LELESSAEGIQLRFPKELHGYILVSKVEAHLESIIYYDLYTLTFQLEVFTSSQMYKFLELVFG